MSVPVMNFAPWSWACISVDGNLWALGRPDGNELRSICAMVERDPEICRGRWRIAIEGPHEYEGASFLDRSAAQTTALAEVRRLIATGWRPSWTRPEYVL